MVAPTGGRLELPAVDVEPSTWNEPIAALRADVPTQPGQSVTSTPPTRVRWRRAAARSGTPRETHEPGLRIAFVADPDGNLVELLSSDEEAPPS